MALRSTPSQSDSETGTSACGTTAGGATPWLGAAARTVRATASAISPQVVPGVRHGAVRVDGGTLHVFYSEIGDRPECIKHCTVDLRSDWLEWKASRSSVVLQPEEPWEGADLRLASSQSGWAPERVRELRDPALFEDVDGTWYILYSIAGESGIAIAEIKEW